MPITEAAREARARRLVRKEELQLLKSRRWIDRGCFAIRNPFHNIIVFGMGQDGFDASLDDIENWLAD